MKHFLYILTALFATASFIVSCSSEETYAEMREKELNSISNFIARHGIQVISKDQFEAQGCQTDSNQYVLFNNTGVYMNIQNKGTDGSILANKGNATIVSRFEERNITSYSGIDSLVCTNKTVTYSMLPDKYTVYNNSGTYTASFTDGAMYRTYGSTTVPGGWLVPLKYINLGRGNDKPLKAKDGSDSIDSRGIVVPGKCAHVRIIVPHDQGTSNASSNVLAMWYDLTYELAYYQ